MCVGWKVHRLYKDILMECKWMRFIFQHNPPCGQCTSSISVTVFVFRWSKKVKIWHNHINFSPPPPYINCKNENAYHLSVWFNSILFVCCDTIQLMEILGAWSEVEAMHKLGCYWLVIICPWHIGKLSCWYATLDTLRSTVLSNVISYTIII